MLVFKGNAAQPDPGVVDGDKIAININVYHQSPAEFARRKNLRDWAEHPLPPSSMYRVAPMAAGQRNAFFSVRLRAPPSMPMSDY